MRVEKEGLHTYLVDMDCENPYFFTAEYPMIKNNTPPNLLPVQVREQDGERHIYYETTGKVSLQDWSQRRKIAYGDLRFILENLLRLFHILEDYMLSMNQIVLCKEYIFIDSKDGIQWMYSPHISHSFQSDMETFFLWILTNTDYQDSQGVSLIHQIYDDVKEGGICKEKVEFYLGMGSQGEQEDQKPPSSKVGFDQDVLREDSEIILEEPEDRNDSLKSSLRSKNRRKNSRQLMDCVLLSAKIILILFDLLLIAYWGYGIRRYGVNQKSMITIAMMFLVLLIFVITILVDHRKKNGRKKDRRKLGRKEEIRPQSQMKTEEKTIFEELEQHWGKGDETILLSDGISNELPTLYNPLTHQVVQIQVFPFYIGSEEGLNQLSLKNKTVSRQHAVIVRGEEGIFYIEDLDSKNGTLVDGQRLIPENAVPIRDGSQIKISNEVWLFQALTPTNITSIMNL